jgi:hypothetical protein
VRNEAAHLGGIDIDAQQMRRRRGSIDQRHHAAPAHVGYFQTRTDAEQGIGLWP